MTTILDQSAPNTAQLHALVIGVGAYPELALAQENDLNLPYELRRLGTSLTSPPISAYRITQWLEHTYHNPTAPLGSLELLMSDPSSNTGQVSYTTASGRVVMLDLPTRANITRAFRRWLNRCDTNQGNIALLYFCGHGLLLNDKALLLPSDFGDTTGVVAGYYDLGIDFTGTTAALSRCRAGIQLLIADACKTEVSTPSGTVSNTHILSDPMLHGRSRHSRSLMMFDAAAPGTRAFGIPGKPTRLASALLQALNGLGAVKIQGHWQVTPAGLFRAVESVLERENALPDAIEQRSGGRWEGGTRCAIHVTHQAPLVPVNLTCDPALARQHATLHFSQRHTVVPATTQSHNEGWLLDLPAAVYNVDATFPPYAQFSEGECELSVQPPYTEECIRCL